MSSGSIFFDTNLLLCAEDQRDLRKKVLVEQWIERAWYWMDEAQVTYWDGLILGAAERLGCTVLLSEDFQAGRVCGTVRVVNPFAAPTQS